MKRLITFALLLLPALASAEKPTIDFQSAAKEDVLSAIEAFDKADGVNPVRVHGVTFTVEKSNQRNLVLNGHVLPMPHVQKIFRITPPGSKIPRLFVWFHDGDSQRVFGHSAGLYIYTPERLNTWDNWHVRTLDHKNRHNFELGGQSPEIDPAALQAVLKALEAQKADTPDCEK